MATGLLTTSFFTSFFTSFPPFRCVCLSIMIFNSFIRDCVKFMRSLFLYFFESLRMTRIDMTVRKGEVFRFFF